MTRNKIPVPQSGYGEWRSPVDTFEVFDTENLDVCEKCCLYLENIDSVMKKSQVDKERQRLILYLTKDYYI